MRIGVDARPLSYRLTGIGVYLKHILQALSEIDKENQYFLISNGPINYELKNPKWHKIEGKLKKKLLSTFWMQVQAPILATRLKLDLFWSPRHHLPLLLPRKVKTVLTIHDIVHFLYPETMPLPHLLVERLLMRWSVLKADQIITVSQSTASGLQKACRVDMKRVEIIYSGAPVLMNGISAKRNVYGVLPSRYFLCVGTVEPRKNFDRILRAFELINPRSHDTHLVIVGDKGWKRKAFLNRLKRHPFRDRVHLTGYVDCDIEVHLYKHAVCLLFPSLYEGFGFPILEAMACGVPVITSNVSSMPEVAGDTALLVDPYDVRALAGAMHQILSNAELKEDLVMKGLERVKRFSWKRCAAETIQACERAFST